MNDWVLNIRQQTSIKFIFIINSFKNSDLLKHTITIAMVKARTK